MKIPPGANDKSLMQARAKFIESWSPDLSNLKQNHVVRGNV